MRRVVVGVVALTVLLLGAVPVMANNTWAEYHWADGVDLHDGSISLSLIDDLTAYSTENGLVLGDWDGGPGPLALASTKAAVIDRPVACDNVNTGAAGDAISGTIHVCNDVYGENGWLGLARIWIAGDGHIEAGVALMNDSYTFKADSVYNNPVAWQHVLCQEIGHTFGLDHQGSPRKQSCMNDRWGLTSIDFDSPNQHDYDTLNEIYGSGDAGDGDGSKPCNPNRKNCPANGANVTVTPRAGGGWIVTFTFPAGLGLR